MSREGFIQYPDSEVPKGIFFSMLLLFFNGIALFLALLYNRQSLVIFCLILLLLGVLLRIWSQKSPNQLHFASSVSKDRLFPGEQTTLTLNVHNRKLLPVFFNLKLSLSGLVSPENSEVTIAENSGLLWHQQLTIRKELTLNRRGIYKTDSPRMITGDFFGFFPVIKKVRGDNRIIVYPRLNRMKPFPVLKRIMFGKPAMASLVQDPVYLLGTRDYRDLSPARNIHWKASARYDKLQEKIFEPTEQEKVLLILEAEGFYEENDKEGFEKTVEAVGSLAVALDTNHFAVGLLSNCSTADGRSANLAIRRRAGHIPAILELLAGILDRPGEKAEIAFQNRRNFPTGVSCLYFSHGKGIGIEYLHQQRIPTTNILVRKTKASLNGASGTESGVLYVGLKDIRLED